MGTNTLLHGSTQKHSVKWHLLLDLLSNKRSLWGCLYITTTETFTQLFTMFRDEEHAPVNYVCAISSLPMCILDRVTPAWIHLKCGLGHNEERDGICFYFACAVNTCYFRALVLAFSVSSKICNTLYNKSDCSGLNLRPFSVVSTHTQFNSVSLLLWKQSANSKCFQRFLVLIEVAPYSI